MADLVPCHPDGCQSKRVLEIGAGVGSSDGDSSRIVRAGSLRRGVVGAQPPAGRARGVPNLCRPLAPRPLRSMNNRVSLRSGHGIFWTAELITAGCSMNVKHGIEHETVPCGRRGSQTGC